MIAVEGLLRDLVPQVLGPLARRHGNFDDAEDAVQEALIAAAAQWPTAGCRLIRARGSSRSPSGV